MAARFPLLAIRGSRFSSGFFRQGLDVKELSVVFRVFWKAAILTNFCERAIGPRLSVFGARGRVSPLSDVSKLFVTTVIAWVAKRNAVLFLRIWRFHAGRFHGRRVAAENGPS